MKVRAAMERMRATANKLRNGWAKKRTSRQTISSNKKVSSMLDESKKIEARILEMKKRFIELERHPAKDKIMLSEFVLTVRNYMKLHEKIGENSIKLYNALIAHCKKHGIPSENLIIYFQGKSTKTIIGQLGELIQFYENRRPVIKENLRQIDTAVSEKDFESMKKLLLGWNMQAI